MHTSIFDNIRGLIKDFTKMFNEICELLKAGIYYVLQLQESSESKIQKRGYSYSLVRKITLSKKVQPYKRLYIFHCRNNC